MVFTTQSTTGVRYLHGLEVKSDPTDVVLTLDNPPLTGPRLGVGGGVAGVGDVGDVPGDGPPAGAGAHHAAGAKPSQ